MAGAPLCPQARPVRCVGLDRLLWNEGGTTVFMLPGLVTVDAWRVLSFPFEWEFSLFAGAGRVDLCPPSLSTD